MADDPTPYLRHIQACRNANPAKTRLPFRLGSIQVGWLDPALRDELLGLGGRVDRTGVTLPNRRELFDVRATPNSAPLTQIDRGALPAFGIEAVGVHLNGLVARADGLHLWVARRGADRPLDPGKLDHLAAGGIPAGLDARATLIKEAAEEAAIPKKLAAQARLVGEITYMMDRPEGLRRDRLRCFDLTLPENFIPKPVDGEVAAFELWPIERVKQRVRDSDDFKFNVNLVLIDLFLRVGVLESPAVREALNGEGLSGFG
jgi:hypothetical protein